MRTRNYKPQILRLLLQAALCVSALPAVSAPSLFDPAIGNLTLVTSVPGALSRVDGLAFDPSGNLFAALEVVGNGGGIVYVDKNSGSVSGLLAAISGADQIKYASPGRFYVTSELNPPPSPGGIYRLDVTYGGGLPLSAASTYLTTAPGIISNPEGLVVLPSSSGFGSAGDLIIAEDLTNGRVIKVALGSSPAATTLLVSSDKALQRPEGLAFGDFSGRAPQALYAAETLANRVLRIDAAGNVSEFGNSSEVGLKLPDNLAFGPDGFLYVTEDLTGTESGRIMRLDANGNYSTFAQGFKKPAGLAFDPLTGHLYIAEQDSSQIWRVEFAAAVPEPATYTMLLAGLAMLGGAMRKRRQASPPAPRQNRREAIALALKIHFDD
jgi:DNA-binding beta-propeller fold protein YncE